MIRELVGFDRITITMPAEDSTVGKLREILGQQYPSLSPLLPFSQVAVDQQVADDSTQLNPESEIAILPPASGG